MVANRIKTELRHTGVLARYGGDEFVALLPETPADLARRASASRNLLQRQPADGADGIDIGLDVSLLGEIAVELVDRRRRFALQRLVVEAQEQLFGLRFLDGHHQRGAGSAQARGCRGCGLVFGFSRCGKPVKLRLSQRARLVPTFQELILKLQSYWDRQGCALLQPYDMEVGAGTSHTATFLRALGPEPWRAAYVQPSRRPKDGRYGDNPNRLQHYYQYQVVLKPSPPDIIDLYLDSLAAIGLDLQQNDVRFVEDDWENATLGAWGLGWEVWLNGMEVTQFTYFQQVGGMECKPITGEITYGIERLAMYLQGVENVFDLVWTTGVTYRDVYHQNEVEQSTYNFEQSDAAMLFRHFSDHEAEAKSLMQARLALPAYEQVLKAAHTFNLLDARGAISVTERAAYIGRIRNLARSVSQSYFDSRIRSGFPMCSPEQLTRLGIDLPGLKTDLRKREAA